jgi:subtilisin family serine protease
MMAARLGQLDGLEKELKEGGEYAETMAKYQANIAYDPRNLVGDNYADSKEHVYGNNRVLGPNGDHGTHVAGIIGANRTNTVGMQGVANSVQIMALRVVPNGDERDKDVANAIIYAVDNGAKVINMSFGKSWSYDKAAVDAAVRYAATRDVLLVHAAGNDGLDLNEHNNVPNPMYADGGKADNFLTIGASSWKKGQHLTADFSNYGKGYVDVFSPGVDIYSTVTGGNKYDSYSGTSMASPVAAGVAALLRSYFPTLTAAQVREIMMTSSTKILKPVLIPGEKKETALLSELCISGGVVNAAAAVKMALEKTK